MPAPPNPHRSWAPSAPNSLAHTLSPSSKPLIPQRFPRAPRGHKSLAFQHHAPIILILSTRPATWPGTASAPGSELPGRRRPTKGGFGATGTAWGFPPHTARDPRARARHRPALHGRSSTRPRREGSALGNNAAPAPPHIRRPIRARDKPMTTALPNAILGGRAWQDREPWERVSGLPPHLGIAPDRTFPANFPGDLSPLNPKRFKPDQAKRIREHQKLLSIPQYAGALGRRLN
jgi:hypothetical protein